ncbi:hypothetical protein ACFX1T_042953 [Malus domestica]
MKTYLGYCTPRQAILTNETGEARGMLDMNWLAVMKEKKWRKTHKGYNAPEATWGNTWYEKGANTDCRESDFTCGSIFQDE